MNTDLELKLEAQRKLIAELQIENKKLTKSLQEIVRITDRNHVAWYVARLHLKMCGSCALSRISSAELFCCKHKFNVNSTETCNDFIPISPAAETAASEPVPQDEKETL